MLCFFLFLFFNFFLILFQSTRIKDKETSFQDESQDELQDDSKDENIESNQNIEDNANNEGEENNKDNLGSSS